MRLVDLVLRQGHLSEQALTRAVLEGLRPAHLDRCDVCAHRALDLGRWLDESRTLLTDAADHVFPAERLAAQQTQIMRRLAQMDEPARVINFPAGSSGPARQNSRRRVAPAWVGVAAAAGLVVGVIGGQLAARLESGSSPRSATVLPPQPVQPPVTEPIQPSLGSILEMDLERLTPDSLRGMDDITPRLVPATYTVALRN